jgi:hypothetical protein
MLPIMFACQTCPKNGSGSGELDGSMVGATKYDPSFSLFVTFTHIFRWHNPRN